MCYSIHFYVCFRNKEDEEDNENQKREDKKVPLSLEELLAKKKAEEAALSKVQYSGYYAS